MEWLKDKLNRHSKERHLYHAASNGWLHDVQRFLEQGARVDWKESEEVASDALQAVDGQTPLYVAALNGHESVVAGLVQHGADVHATNRLGSNPLDIAVRKGHVGIMELLIRAGADIRSTNQNGHSPLHVAALNGHLDMAKDLLEKGANIHAKDSRGYTPLHLASHNGHLEVVMWLLEKGADPSIKSNAHKTARDIAIKQSISNALDIGRAPPTTQPSGGVKRVPDVPVMSATPSPAPLPVPVSPRNTRACVVCMDRPQAGVCVPCGHHAMCMVCADRLLAQPTKACPVCRGAIQAIVRLFQC